VTVENLGRGVTANVGPMPDWSLLSLHGQILQLIHREPRLTQSQIAGRVGVTARTVNRIFADLRDAEYIVANSRHRHLGHTINLHAKLHDGTNLADWLERLAP